MDTQPDAFSQMGSAGPFPSASQDEPYRAYPGMNENTEIGSRIKVHGTSILLRGTHTHIRTPKNALPGLVELMTMRKNG